MERTDHSSRFRDPKSVEDEESLLHDARPKSTIYKNRWSVDTFRSWQRSRVIKFPTVEVGSVLRDYNVREVQSVEENLEDMNSSSLNYWLTKFVQEVANKNGGRYPPRTLYGIVCGIKRHLEEQNGANALNPLDNSDKRYVLSNRVHSHLILVRFQTHDNCLKK